MAIFRAASTTSEPDGSANFIEEIVGNNGNLAYLSASSRSFFYLVIGGLN
jgi:hypothetical protein